MFSFLSLDIITLCTKRRTGNSSTVVNDEVIWMEVTSAQIKHGICPLILDKKQQYFSQDIPSQGRDSNPTPSDYGVAVLIIILTEGFDYSSSLFHCF